jgi:hypothetical protein
MVSKVDDRSVTGLDQDEPGNKIFKASSDRLVTITETHTLRLKIFSKRKSFSLTPSFLSVPQDNKGNKLVNFIIDSY